MQEFAVFVFCWVFFKRHPHWWSRRAVIFARATFLLFVEVDVLLKVMCGKCLFTADGWIGCPHPNECTKHIWKLLMATLEMKCKLSWQMALCRWWHYNITFSLMFVNIIWCCINLEITIILTTSICLLVRNNWILFLISNMKHTRFTSQMSFSWEPCSHPSRANGLHQFGSIFFFL